MSYLKKASFTFGEIDPSLHDKTDLQTYYSGLKTAKNVVVNKTGRILNTAGTWFNTLPDTNNDVRIYVPTQPQYITASTSYQDYLLEFGAGYVRGFNLTFDNQTNRYKLVEFDDAVTAFVQSDIPGLRFETVEDTVDNTFKVCVSSTGSDGFTNLSIYVTVADNVITVADLETDHPVILNDTNPAFNYMTYTDLYKNQAAVTAQLGVPVDYGITVVTKSGIESELIRAAVYTYTDGTNNALSPKLPTNDEFNSVTFSNFEIADANYAQNISHFNVYRRPKSNLTTLSGRSSYGNAYGLIGSTPFEGLYVTGDPITISFIDFGQEADFSNPPPGFFASLTFGSNYSAKGFVQYNSRLGYYNGNIVTFSRPKAPRYLLRDFPLTQSTCFRLTIGEQSTEIYHAANYNGLYFFTSSGIYYGGGIEPVSSLNPIVKLVNDSIIDKDIAPIITPFGLLFVDDSSKTIKMLMYDDQLKSVSTVEISSASDHLFYGKRVVDWAFYTGENPVLFVILNDGTAATYSWNKNTGITAWTRHDTDGLYKRVVAYRSSNSSDRYLIFLVYRNGNYMIETSSVRTPYTPGETGFSLTGGSLSRAFSHSSVLFYNTYNPGGGVVKAAKAYTVVAGADTLWENTVRVTSSVDAFLEDRVGSTFGIWDTSTNSWYYMDLLSATTGGTAVFTITGEAFPTHLRSTSVTMIECHTVITGLSHLNGKAVSVNSDDVVIGSPYNAIEALTTYTVASGEITLPTPRAYSVVGLPYVSDVKTLKIDTKNGTTALDNKIVNEIAVRLVRTRGVYASNEFPSDNTNTGMEAADEWSTEDIINRPLAEKTGMKRYRPDSAWADGEIAIRQVDPLPFEIVSIILDASTGKGG